MLKMEEESSPEMSVTTLFIERQAKLFQNFHCQKLLNGLELVSFIGG